MHYALQAALIAQDLFHAENSFDNYTPYRFKMISKSAPKQMHGINPKCKLYNFNKNFPK